MRFGIHLEFFTDRDKPEKPEEPHPEGNNYADTQLAGPQKIGFTVDMPDHEQ